MVYPKAMPHAADDFTFLFVTDLGLGQLAHPYVVCIAMGLEFSGRFTKVTTNEIE